MKKFLFNQMFDEEVIERQRQQEAARIDEERIAEENAPPTYTVEELEAAKIAAHQQGMQEGKAEALASIEQQANLTLDLILRQIGDLLAEYKNWTNEVHHDSISMALSIMRKLAPELLRGSELPQVEHIVNEAFQFLTDQPKVMIRVASDLEDELIGKVNLMASRVGYEGQVVLTGDPELELTDCRISWYAGAVERSLDETWGQIDEMVDRVLRGLPAREHPEPAEEDEETAEDEETIEDETQETVEDERPEVADPEPEPVVAPSEALEDSAAEASLTSEAPGEDFADNSRQEHGGDDDESLASGLMNDVEGTPLTPPQTEPGRAFASEE
jgi:flagellar assembly protein FliH